MADLDHALKLLKNPDRTEADVAEAGVLIKAAIGKERAASLRRDRWEARLDRVLHPVAVVWYSLRGFASGGFYWLVDGVSPALGRAKDHLRTLMSRTRRPRR